MALESHVDGGPGVGVSEAAGSPGDGSRAGLLLPGLQALNLLGPAGGHQGWGHYHLFFHFDLLSFKCCGRSFWLEPEKLSMRGCGFNTVKLVSLQSPLPISLHPHKSFLCPSCLSVFLIYKIGGLDSSIDFQTSPFSSRTSPFPPQFTPRNPTLKAKRSCSA